MARDGVDALQVAEGEGQIDLLLSDVVMPRMGGHDLAARLKGRFPGLKILLVSGYAMDSEVAGNGLGEQVHFMPKPYRPSVLVEKIREVLGEGR